MRASRPRSLPRSFNEAGAFCAGKSAMRCKLRATAQGFNEAGAFCAGKYRRVRLEFTIPYASMRPARSAPENLHNELEHWLLVVASMRPARSAPENGKCVARASPTADCFNEAGAFCAGKCPDGPRRHAAVRVASMRPARSAPENVGHRRRTVHSRTASMRPARSAPENSFERHVLNLTHRLQ